MVHDARASVNRATARFILRSGSAASKGSSPAPPSPIQSLAKCNRKPAHLTENKYQRSKSIASSCRNLSTPPPHATKHDSQGTDHASRFTNHRSLPTHDAFLIATQILNLDLTHSQQTRKHFLIATKYDSSARASALHVTDHDLRIASFLFDTNKAHKIIILMRALLKTKEKQFSIRYKFALREINRVSPGARMQNVRNFRCHSNVACLGVPVVLTSPAASGQKWFAWLGMGA
jgi:hypothetical protein